MDTLAGKVVLVTGAGRGQGRTICTKFAEEGAAVIAVDICADIDSVPYPLSNESDLADTAKFVEGAGGRVVTVQADTRDAATLKAGVDAAVTELGGRLDICCANAAVTTYGGVIEATDDQWHDLIDVNLTGTWNACRVAVPHILSGRRGGSLVLTSSTMGLMAYPGIAPYVAAKHGVVGLMRALAVELAPANIRVNTVHPTSVSTGMIHNEATYRRFRPDLENPTVDDAMEAFQGMNLLPTPWLEPQTISDAIVHLCTDESRYITGTTMVIDAGAMLKRNFG